MKAAVLHEIGQPFRIEEVAEPRIGPAEVLIETHTCGICRTDLHIQEGLAYIPTLPHIPGHEPAGVVIEVGKNVTHVKVGQRVVPYLFVICGHCPYCRTGRHAQCANVAGIIGVTLPGGFAEYFKAPADNLLPLPDNVGFDIGGLMSCAVITAVHAYRRAQLGTRDTAVVIGAGGIGQILIQLLKSAGVHVVAVDRSTESLRLAAEAGAALTLLSDRRDTAERIQEFSGGDGVQCAFELVGKAATMKTAAACLRRDGQIVVVGEELEWPPIDTIQIAQRELKIIGSRNGSLQDAADALAMMAAGIIVPPIAGRFPLEDYNQALDFMRSGRAYGRVVMTIRA